MPPTFDAITPILVLVALVAFFAAAVVLSRNYIKVSPNTVAVLSGRKRTQR